MPFMQWAKISYDMMDPLTISLCVRDTRRELCEQHVPNTLLYYTQNTNIVSPSTLAAPRTRHTQVHVALLPRQVAKNVTHWLMSVPYNVFIFTISFVHLRTFRTKWFFGLLLRRVCVCEWVSVWYIIRKNGMRNVIIIIKLPDDEET